MPETDARQSNGGAEERRRFDQRDRIRKFQNNWKFTYREKKVVASRLRRDSNRTYARREYKTTPGLRTSATSMSTSTAAVPRTQYDTYECSTESGRKIKVHLKFHNMCKRTLYLIENIRSIPIVTITTKRPCFSDQNDTYTFYHLILDTKHVPRRRTLLLPVLYVRVCDTPLCPKI